MKKLMKIILLSSVLVSVCTNTSFAMKPELAGRRHAREDDEIQNGRSTNQNPRQPTNSGGVSGAMLAHAFGFAGKKAADTAMVCHSEILNTTAPRCAHYITSALRTLLNVDSFCWTREVKLIGATDKDLELIAQKCIQLEEINLADSPRITNAGLAYLAQYAGWLKKLTLPQFPWTQPITAQAMQEIIPQLKCLEELDLSRTQVTNEAVHAIVKGCPNLRKLSLVYCHQLTNLAIQSDRLEELDLSDTNITDETVQAIVEGCPNLKTLYLLCCEQLINPIIKSDRLKELNLLNTNITDEAVQAIVEGCPNLKTLYLFCCTQLINPTIKSDRLEELNLSGTQVTDEAVQAIVKECPNLRKLNLVECNKLTNLTIQSDSLKNLNLYRCFYLTNLTIQSNRLEELNVSRTQATDEAVNLIRRNCPNLRELFHGQDI